ncbi:hypothetical protein [Phenylobacterium sp.]|uniref:hypothetical protein n=1 Tax=Phenylobacterium sp. TaxID=1871053 RepID=UPI0037CAE3A2
MRALATPPPLPPSEEVEAYVSQNWSDYAWRFANFARQPGVRFQLISVRAVTCVYHYATIPGCSFDVVARPATGPEITQRLSSQFDRDAGGALTEVIVMLHERRRR